MAEGKRNHLRLIADRGELVESFSSQDDFSDAQVGHAGQCADSEPNDEDVAKATSLAVRALAASPKTRAQLQRKLVDRDFSSDVVARSLQSLEDSGLIDDAEYAEWWIRAKATKKVLAAAGIRRELSQAGVSNRIIDAALSEIDDDDQRARGQELVRSKLNRMRELPSRDSAAWDALLRRLAGMLARKGYPPAEALALVIHVLKDVESVD